MMIIEKILTPLKANGLQARPDRTMNPTSVTLHNTGNPTANALQYAESQSAGGLAAMTMAAHYYVDDADIIYQCLEDTQQGWHAGDGSNMRGGNYTSIAIAVCEQTGIDQHKAFENAAWLSAALMKRHSFEISAVKRHKDWPSAVYPTGKDCPHILLEGRDGMTCDWFLALIKSNQSSEPAVGGEAIVNVSTTLNLRENPDVSANIITRLTSERAIYILSKNGSWAEVVAWQDSKYYRGWCAWQYLIARG